MWTERINKLKKQQKQLTIQQTPQTTQQPKAQRQRKVKPLVKVDPIAFQREFQELQQKLEKKQHEINEEQDYEQKNELRIQFIKNHWDHVDHFVAHDQPFQNPIIVWMYIWSGSERTWSEFFQLFEIGNKYKQHLPTEWKRTWSDFFTDTILKWAEARFKMGDSISRWFEPAYAFFLEPRKDVFEDRQRRIHVLQQRRCERWIRDRKDIDFADKNLLEVSILGLEAVIRTHLCHPEPKSKTREEFFVRTLEKLQEFDLAEEMIEKINAVRRN